MYYTANSLRNMTTVYTDNAVIHTFAPTESIFEKILHVIEEEGHKCGRVENNKVVWCENDFCPKWYDDMAEKDAEQEEFAKKLEADGHKCVDRAESYPAQIMWCRQEKCTYT